MIPTAMIEVTDADWGGAEPADIQAVCMSVMDCFSVAIAEKPLEQIRIEPSLLIPPRPRTVYERLDSGQVLVLLAVQGSFWAQLAYQFAHELCHVLANIPTVSPAPNCCDWIEESLAETASLFALRSMARRWEHAAPHDNWRDYRVHLATYAAEILGDPKHGVPGEEFGDWMVRTLPLLMADPYQREANSVVAIRLLPIFETDPLAWGALRYLNLWHEQDQTVADYFKSWTSHAPNRYGPALEFLELAIRGS